MFQIKKFIKIFFNSRFQRSFSIFKGNVSLVLNKDKDKIKESLNNLLNSSEYPSLALPHFKRLELYKEHVENIKQDLIMIVNDIFVGKISLKKQQQEIIISYLKNILYKEEVSIIKTENTFLAQKKMKQLSLVISNNIYTIFDKAFIEVRESMITKLGITELNESAIRIKKRKEHFSELFWKIISHIITFLLGAFLGYLFTSK